MVQYLHKLRFGPALRLPSDLRTIVQPYAKRLLVFLSLSPSGYQPWTDILLRMAFVWSDGQPRVIISISDSRCKDVIKPKQEWNLRRKSVILQRKGHIGEVLCLVSFWYGEVMYHTACN